MGLRSPTLALDKTVRSRVAALRMTTKTGHQHELSKEMETSCFHSTSRDCELQLLTKGNDITHVSL